MEFHEELRNITNNMNENLFNIKKFIENDSNSINSINKILHDKIVKDIIFENLVILNNHVNKSKNCIMLSRNSMVVLSILKHEEISDLTFDQIKEIRANLYKKIFTNIQTNRVFLNIIPGKLKCLFKLNN